MTIIRILEMADGTYKETKKERSPHRNGTKTAAPPPDPPPPPPPDPPPPPPPPEPPPPEPPPPEPPKA